jgi:hypothetical protein
MQLHYHYADLRRLMELGFVDTYVHHTVYVGVVKRDQACS